MKTLKDKNFINKISIILIFTIIISTSSSVWANDFDKNSNIEIVIDKDGEINEEAVNQVAEILEYVYEIAAIKDNEGNIVDLRFDLIREKYGNSLELEQLENIMEESKSQVISRGAFTNCMLDAIKDMLGVTSVGILISGGVAKLITKKAWKEVAKLIIKHFAKIGGTYLSVGGVVASLVYYSGKCAWTTRSSSINISIKKGINNEVCFSNYM